MYGSVSPDSEPSPDPTAIRHAVLRICDSRAFRNAPSLRAFLRFVVNKTLSGDAGSIKAYSVAVGALGRPPDFDPASDAIVRVEAGRLRAALKRYYETVQDAVVISLPRGSYVPEFAWRAEPARAAAGAVAKAAAAGGAAGARDENNWVFAEHLARKAECRSSLEQMLGRVADLHADFAATRTTMAQSRMLLERSRARAGAGAGARAGGDESEAPDPNTK